MFLKLISPIPLRVVRQLAMVQNGQAVQRSPHRDNLLRTFVSLAG